MLNYTKVKHFFAEHLITNLKGTGRLESAAYHTAKMIYEQGVRDGMQAAHDAVAGHTNPLRGVGIDDDR